MRIARRAAARLKMRAMNQKTFTRMSLPFERREGGRCSGRYDDVWGDGEDLFRDLTRRATFC